MLKISTSNSTQATTLKLEGKLLVDWLPDLRDAYQRALQQGTSIRFDLEHLTFADLAGENALRELVLAGRVELVSCSSFIRELLQMEVP